ncbi:hypothetical protein [Stenotrophomonas maltophilia]|uniref:hypothetical protein n=1 Tax=Stenotrophomonas maltophilia TaxID=40324 RepID=UPI0013DCEA6C|nr:hypothetical protein [Stenotrophomonas maltophilia]
MTIQLDYLLYGLAAAAVSGVIFAFKRDTLIRSRNASKIEHLKAGLPASPSHRASLDEVDDTVKKIDNSFLLQDEDPYGNHLSTSGEPHGYWGRNRVGPG